MIYLSCSWCPKWCSEDLKIPSLNQNKVIHFILQLQRYISNTKRIIGFWKPNLICKVKYLDWKLNFQPLVGRLFYFNPPVSWELYKISISKNKIYIHNMHYTWIYTVYWNYCSKWDTFFILLNDLNNIF